MRLMSKGHVDHMATDEKGVHYQTSEIGTPRDYTEDVYKVYFEVGEYNERALNILAAYLGEDKAHGIIQLAHGYEVDIPIQCVPDIARLLCDGGIAVYQIVRYAKTDSKWR